jgi:hypothetical protein
LRLNQAFVLLKDNYRAREKPPPSHMDQLPEIRARLRAALAALAERLEPADAVRVLMQAMSEDRSLDPEPIGSFTTGSRYLKESGAKRSLDPGSIGLLATGLMSVAGRLNPAETAQVCREISRLLTQELAEAETGNACVWLTAVMAAMTERLAPADAAHRCREAARQICRAQVQRWGIYDTRAESVSMLIQALESEDATHAARAFISRMVADPDHFLREAEDDYVVNEEEGENYRTHRLERFLADAPRSQVRSRAVAIAAGIGNCVNGPAPGLGILPTAAEPFPCRLSTQDLVEVLKMPTCVLELRRIILTHLGNRYRRRFDTHWDFVRYAQEHGLNLDFTTPPQRPASTLPPLFEE